jgi:predicted RNA-binding Zn ribbon-like protein
MQIQQHSFRPADLVGGHVVLDLLNTVTARDGDPIDWLDSYQRVLEWAALTAHFEPSVLKQLEQLSAAHEDAGTRALHRIHELREAVHDMLAATLRHERSTESTLARVDASWKDAVRHARIAVSGRHTLLKLDVESSRLDYLHHELALRAFELLQVFPPDRTRICAGTNCGWVFIDRSRGGRRRWCDMATCGNVAKSRRHYQRIHRAPKS